MWSVSRASRGPKRVEPHEGGANIDAKDPASFRVSKLHFSDDCELLYDFLVNEHSVTAFLDSGGSHIFMSPDASENCGLKISDSSPTEVALGKSL